MKKYNKITLDELENVYKVNNYTELKNIVLGLINDKKIKIVEASGTNGKKPALYNRYIVIKESEDDTKYYEEINYKIVPDLDITYFRKNINRYKESRKYILR